MGYLPNNLQACNQMSHHKVATGTCLTMEIEFQCNHCGATIEADSEISGIRAECPACNEVVMVPAPGIEPGIDIGGFRVDKRLGVGGMGEVFAATQIAMDRKVALKILPPALTSDEKTVERFLHEVRMAAKLEHPNIVTAFDAGKASGYHYLAMSYVNGEDLSERLKREKRLAEDEAIDIVDKIAHALDYAWDKHHLLHRDIKPANIMLTNDGIVKLMDMGIAKSLEEDSNLTMQGMLVGTPYYMSPEQATGNKDIDCRSDIYSLGATLYHFVTGVRPFNGPNAMSVIAKHLSETPMQPSALNGEVSPGCEALISRMMARQREDRFETWKDLRHAISEMRGGDVTMQLKRSSDPTKVSGMAVAVESSAGGKTGTEFNLGIDENIGLKAATTKEQPQPEIESTMVMDDSLPESAAVDSVEEPAPYDHEAEAKAVSWGMAGAAAAGVLFILVLVGVIALIISRYKEGEVQQKIAVKTTELKEREIVGDITSSLAGHEELKMNRGDLEEMLRLASEYAKNNPDNVSASEKKFKKVIQYAKELDLPKFEMEAEAELEKLRKQSESEREERNKKAAKRIVRVLEIESENLASRYQFGPAANLLMSYRGDYDEETADDRKKAADVILARGREYATIETYIRKAIRLFNAEDGEGLRKHLESAKSNPEIQENRELFRENISPLLSLLTRHNKDRRPLKDRRANRPIGPLPKALAAYRKGEFSVVEEILRPVPQSLFKEVLLGEMNGQKLKGDWAATDFSGAAYTGKVESMALSYDGTKVRVNINNKGSSSGDGHVLGDWLHFSLDGRKKYWQIMDLSSSTLKIQPLPDVTASMQRKK